MAALHASADRGTGAYALSSVRTVQGSLVSLPMPACNGSISEYHNRGVLFFRIASAGQASRGTEIRPTNLRRPQPLNGSTGFDRPTFQAEWANSDAVKTRATRNQSAASSRSRPILSMKIRAGSNVVPATH